MCASAQQPIPYLQSKRTHGPSSTEVGVNVQPARLPETGVTQKPAGAVTYEKVSCQVKVAFCKEADGRLCDVGASSFQVEGESYES